MHASVMAWVGATLTQADVEGRTVLEVGSYNVNGTVRPLVERYRPASYLGVDQTPGPNVDLVLDATRLAGNLPDSPYDIVISTEMLEHATDWQACVSNMAAVLAPGGLLLLTTRSPGFPYHGFPDDHHRFTLPLMHDIMDAIDLKILDLLADPDPKSPGVFIRVRKPYVWVPADGRLGGLRAEPAPPP